MGITKHIDMSQPMKFVASLLRTNKQIALLLSKFSGLLVAIGMLYLLYNVVVVVNNSVQQLDALQATEGKLDLSGFDLDASHVHALAGDWAFYPGRFIQPGEAYLSPQVMYVPGKWNSQGQEEQGFASYRLEVELGRPYRDLALAVPTVATAYTLFVNGMQVSRAGTASPIQALFEPEYKADIVLLKDVGDKLDIIYHVTNFSFARGGVWEAPRLGSAHNIYQFHLSKTIRSVSIAALFFTIALLNLLHFSLRPNDLSPFVLALCCLCLGLREVETSEVLYLSHLFSVSFAVGARINFLTFYAIIPLMFAYCQLSYPKEFHKGFALPLYIVSAIFIGSVVFTPPETFSRYLNLFQYIALISMLYGIFAIALALSRKRKGARMLATGALLLCILGTNDIFYSMGYINTGFMSSLGFLSFILLQNYLVYLRFTQASDENAYLSIKAYQDPLTSLLNRRGMMSSIKAFTQQNTRAQFFSVMILDFDRFKRLNDELGHEAGDLVLANGGKIILDLLGKPDSAARWGGEEFVIFLPGVTLEQSQEIAEKIRTELNYQLSKTLRHPVSASIGIAKSKLGEEFKDVLRRADRALYLAKENGRNRVVTCEQE